MLISRFQLKAIVRALSISLGTFKSLSLSGGVIDNGATGTFGWFTNAMHDGGGFKWPASAGFHTIGVGTVSFSGTSGSGITATFNSTSNGVLTGVAGADVGKEIRLGSCGIVAEITSSTSSLLACTVTVTKGTLQAGFVYGTTIANVGGVKNMVPWRWGLGTDANGYPKYPWWFTVTATGNDGNDGQLASGTYYGNMKALSSATQIGVLVSNVPAYVNTGTPSRTSGATVLTFLSQTFDGTYYNTLFSLVIGSGAQNTTILAGSGEVAGGIDLNRTPGLSSYAPSPTEFWPATIAHHAQIATVRTLGIVQGIGAADTTWDTRVPNYPCISSQFGGGGRQLSWEVICRLATALSLAGGNFKTLWTNTGYAILTQADGVSQAQDYAYNLGLLFNSQLPATIQDENEYCNEDWNTGVKSSNGLSIFQTHQYLAGQETLLLTNHTATNFFGSGTADRYLASLARSGTTATATLNTALPYGIAANGVYQGFVASPDTFAIGSAASPVTMTVSADGLSVSWPDAGTAGTSVSTVNKFIYLNSASDLLGDNNNGNPVYLSYKYYVRQTFRQQQSMQAARSGTRWKLCQQGYGTVVNNPWQGGNRPSSIASALSYYTMGDYLGQKYLGAAPLQGIKAWCYAMGIAPYAQVPGPDWGMNGNLSGTGPTVDESSPTNAINSIIGNPGDAVSTNSLWSIVQIQMAQTMAAHIYQCVQYGIRPQVYEFNIDIQKMTDAVPTSATFNGTVSGATLTLAAPPSTGAKLQVGHYVQYNNLQSTQAIVNGLAITSNASANTDGSGTYTLSASSSTISTSTPMKTGVNPGGLGPLLMADDRAGQLIETLMRIWFQLGGKEMCSLDWSPSRWDSSHDCWGFVQTIAQATNSPRYNHFIGFNDAEYYTNILGALGAGKSVTWAFATTWQREDNLLLNSATTPNVMQVSTSSTLSLRADQLFSVNDAGSYSLTLRATTASVGYAVQVWVNEVQVGSIPVANTGVNGLSASAGATAAASTLTPLHVTLQKGPQIISLRVPAATLGTVGILDLKVQADF